MFNEPKPLLVIYKEKDEMILNHLKKHVDTNESRTTEAVKVVSWDERLWLQNKKAGNTGDLADKILFIGDIKGTDNLAPVISIKFEKHGVSYGFAGNQALLTVDCKQLSKKANYEAFLKELSDISNLAIVKQDKKMRMKNVKQWLKFGVVAVIAIMNFLLGVLASGIIFIDIFADKKLVRKQMLIYGVTQLYLNDLDNFMKS